MISASTSTSNDAREPERRRENDPMSFHGVMV
jgi:hypothetical protein